MKIFKFLDRGFQVRKKEAKRNLCVICKGARNLCGKRKCPLLVKLLSKIKVKPLIEKKEIDGSSPPSVFVGRIGYPKVYVGPLIPPFKGNTEFLDLPEKWYGRSIMEIVDFRFLLVRGMKRIKVFETEGKIQDMLKELALAKKPVDSDAVFKKKPLHRISLSSEAQPFGPSAPLKDLKIYPSKADWRIEKAYYDTDWKASEAVYWLYQKNLPVSKIQRAFSVGLLGIEEKRRLVPTRWSITAVDDIISRKLVEEIKQFETIDEYRVFENYYLDNRWIILMIPRFWSYESMEAWYPGTVWNPEKYIAIGGDWEGFNGRTSYASIGGCYYSGRLACAEYLAKEKRQATVIILREIHPGYIMPVGVWNVRETVRHALENEPKRFETLESALSYIAQKLEIPLSAWIKNSDLLRNLLKQKTLNDFLN